MLVAHSRTAQAISELIGTFAFVGAGAASVAAVASFGTTLDPAAGLVAIAVAHGLVIGTFATVAGHISGGHLNPAVTIGLLATRQKDLITSLLFIAAQLAGAVLGCLFFSAVSPAFDNAGSAIVPALGNGVEPWQGALCEGVLTFLLVWVVFAVAIDRDGTWFRIGGLPIGFVVTGLILAGGTITGASMNPARYFGPALSTGDWTNALLYVAAPLVGGAVAGIAYMTVNDPRTHGAPSARA